MYLLTFPPVQVTVSSQKRDEYYRTYIRNMEMGAPGWLNKASFVKAMFQVRWAGFQFSILITFSALAKTPMTPNNLA